MQDKGDDTGTSPLRITVVGAGMAGLSAAYRLTRPGFCGDLNPQVILLERVSRAGGVISTYELEDYILELGPDMLQTAKPDAIRLLEELGLSEYIIPTNDECRRTYVAYGQKLHPLPEGFQLLAPTKLAPFFTSSLLTMGGKMRMAMDLFIPRKSGSEEESLAQFVRRRFGDEALERIAQPLMGGIYTADPELLSLSATMPRFLELEQKHGSVIRGLMSQKKSGPGSQEKNGEAGCRYSMFVSLKNGLSMIPERMVAAMPADCVHFHCPVVAVEKGSHGKAFDVVVANGTIVPSDAVIISSPSFVAADLLKQMDSELAESMHRIHYASSAVLNLIYNRADIPHPLDGFGFVVPAAEKRHILACSFSSVKFPGRCPKDKAVLRVFVGGAMQPDVFDLSDEHIECLLWEDLNTYLGLKSVPLLSLITRYPRSMPQYHVGHESLVKNIRSRLQIHNGIFLAGSAYDGVGIPDNIRSGEEAAKQTLELLKNIKAPVT